MRIEPDRVLDVGEGWHVTVFAYARACYECRGSKKHYCHCDDHQAMGCPTCGKTGLRDRLQHWSAGPDESTIPVG